MTSESRVSNFAKGKFDGHGTSQFPRPKVRKPVRSHHANRAKEQLRHRVHAKGMR